jgi:hypothetical protein
MEDEYEDDFYVTKNEAQRRRHGTRAQAFARVSTWLGAGLALLLIVGVVMWGYRLGQRDASAVPVIRASLEPAKVQPEEPGGAEIAHQDIASYDAGSGAEPPAEITFAAPPERPAEEDVAMGALAVVETEGSETAAADATDRPADATEDAAGSDATDLAPEASPLVLRRPGDLAQRMAAARRASTEEDELAKRAAASPVQIQLGAFPDRSLTKSEWTRIYKANEDILSGRALVVQSTISGGRRFFRLRAGPFRDRVEAQNVCRALQARGQDCLVAVNG